MRRGVRLAVALASVAIGLAGLVSPAAATGHSSRVSASAGFPAPTPVTQAIFSDPMYDSNAIRQFERHLIGSTLRHVESGDPALLLQASLYHLSDVRLAHQFVYAARAGMQVQVLLDGSNRRLGCNGKPGCVNPAFRVLHELNNGQHPGSWFRTCSGIGPGGDTPTGHGNGCIGQARDHNKFILLSAGYGLEKYPYQNVYSHYIVVQTSSNNTHASYTKAFNDALVLANRPIVYSDYQSYFNRLAAAYDDPKPPSVKAFNAKYGHTVDTTTPSTHDIATWSYPQPPHHDPIANALEGVQATKSCKNPTGDGTGPARTSIAVAMSRIDGRPQAMHRLVQLEEAGCFIQVVYAQISESDREYLSTAGIGLHRLCLASPANLSNPFEYVHSKYILINGSVYGVGSNARVVITGSENLDHPALVNSDDRMIRYVETADDDPIYRSYAQNFFNLLALTKHGHQATSGCSNDD